MKMLFIGFLVFISTEVVVAQQINEFLQKDLTQKLDTILDPQSRSQASNMGELYQANNKIKNQSLKSTTQEPAVRLMDSLLIYTYASGNDSLLMHYHSKEYNIKNQLTFSKYIYKLYLHIEYKYSYNEQNDTSLIEEILYENGEYAGAIKDHYEYNQKNQVKSILSTEAECYFRHYWAYPEILSSYYTPCSLSGSGYGVRGVKTEFEYGTDHKGRDTSIIISLFRGPFEDEKDPIASVTRNYKYYETDTIKELVEKNEIGWFDQTYQYNEHGSLVYYEKGPYFRKFGYDSSNTLRYVKKYDIHINNDSAIVERYIIDTLSNAHAVYTDDYILNGMFLKHRKKLLLVFYNDDDLISNTREYIWSTSELQWQISYEDTLIYNDRNQISEYYLGTGRNIAFKYPYKELYIYDDEGSKIGYEEYRINTSFNYYSPTYKEFYYYSYRSPTYIPENILLENIKVYPNPVRGYLYIKNESPVQNLAYNLFSINGQILETGMMLNDTRSIDLSFYPPAMYYLKLYSRDKNELTRTVLIAKL